MEIEPDWNVHAFQRAQAIQGQANSVATEFTIKMLGLDICADTICGNHMMRGISGGQKKRVTSGMPCRLDATIVPNKAQVLTLVLCMSVPGGPCQHRAPGNMPGMLMIRSISI